MGVCVCSSGEPVVVSVKLEREDEEEVSPYVIAPFFPQVCVCVCTCAKRILSFLFSFFPFLILSHFFSVQRREEGWWVVIGDPKNNR